MDDNEIWCTFLAAMSSSRSDDVTKFVCPSGVILFSFVLSKHLKQEFFRGVSQGCLFEVSRKFQGCFKEV